MGCCRRSNWPRRSARCRSGPSTRVRWSERWKPAKPLAARLRPTDPEGPGFDRKRRGQMGGQVGPPAVALIVLANCPAGAVHGPVTRGARPSCRLSCAWCAPLMQSAKGTRSAICSLASCTPIRSSWRWRTISGCRWIIFSGWAAIRHRSPMLSISPSGARLVWLNRQPPFARGRKTAAS